MAVALVASVGLEAVSASMLLLGGIDGSNPRPAVSTSAPLELAMVARIGPSACVRHLTVTSQLFLGGPFRHSLLVGQRRSLPAAEWSASGYNAYLTWSYFWATAPGQRPKGDKCRAGRKAIAEHGIWILSTAGRSTFNHRVI
jgi:hypothetical protein